MPRDSQERHIPFDSCANFRDAGGYRTRQGQRVRWGKLFRSADLCYMTEQDAKHARDALGIQTVIDLRSSHETESFGYGPLSLPPVEYNNVPLTHGIAGPDNPSPALADFYLHWLGTPQFWERLAEALAVIARPTACPVVFYCSGGKDRTGLLAAMVQGILGVANADIVADYALTAKSAIPPAVAQGRKARLQANPATAKRLQEIPTYWYYSHPETMEEVLEAVQQEHGSIRDYAEARGVSAQVLQRLEDELLSES